MDIFAFYINPEKRMLGYYLDIDHGPVLCMAHNQPLTSFNWYGKCYG
jgi:hypothetical protein